MSTRWPLPLVRCALPAGAPWAVGDSQEGRRLVRAAATGDAAAFRELYRRHLPTVQAWLTLMVGPGPERDDLIHRIFLDAYRALSRFRGDARFGTFVNRVASNVACDHLERRRRNRGRYARLEEAQLDRLVTPDASPESRARQRRNLALAFEQLDAIHPKKRIAFVLVAIQRMSLDGAAELLATNAETVQQRVQHARIEITARMAGATPSGNATDLVDADVIAPLRRARLALDDLQLARLSTVLDTAFRGALTGSTGAPATTAWRRGAVGIALAAAASAALVVLRHCLNG